MERERNMSSSNNNTILGVGYMQVRADAHGAARGLPLRDPCIPESSESRREGDDVEREMVGARDPQLRAPARTAAPQVEKYGVSSSTHNPHKEPPQQRLPRFNDILRKYAPYLVVVYILITFGINHDIRLQWTFNTVPGQTLALRDTYEIWTPWFQSPECESYLLPHPTRDRHHDLQELVYVQRGGKVPLSITCGKLDVEVCSDSEHTVVVHAGYEETHETPPGCHKVSVLSDVETMFNVYVILEPGVTGTFIGSCTRLERGSYVLKDTRTEGLPKKCTMKMRNDAESIFFTLTISFLLVCMTMIIVSAIEQSSGYWT